MVIVGAARRRLRVPLIAIGGVLISVSVATAATPKTSITSGPSGLIGRRSATFRFAASLAGATFQCELDGSGWASCTSPKKYSHLAQGAHQFRVRARKGGAVDSTPAVRTFKVDTVRPNTRILSGPTGITKDHTPRFTFSSTEPGSFKCRLASSIFKLCKSPFVRAAPLPDGSYKFAVKAIDAIGHVDRTPASRTFSVETPVTQTLTTARAAAKLYFPDAIDLDVPASCGGSRAVDCTGMNPDPPADQLRVTSTRSVVEVVDANRYDVTVTSGVQTLAPIKVNYAGTGDCVLTMTSANGTDPDWTAQMSLSFVEDPSWREKRIERGDLTISGVEGSDWTVTGGSSCAFAPASTADVVDIYRQTLFAHFAHVGDPMCAARGPAYLGPCPE